MLTLLFRTCSIYFANGSTVDVAKIEGSTRYKYVMRHIQATDRTHHPGKPSTRNPFLSRLHHDLPFPSLLRSALNRWQHRSPDATAIGDMLLALKTAAESYLGVPVPTADLVIPMSISPSGRHILESASSSAGLDRAAGFPVAGSLAAMANGIGAYYQHPERCRYDDVAPSQLVLTVDYSRAALTAILYLEEMCVFDVLRMRHDVNLGAAALNRCQASTNNEDCYKDLAEALLQIVKMPVEDVESDIPTKVGSLVLLGEKGTDPRLRQVLQQVLAEQSISIALRKSKHEGSAMVDPTFAAARGIAAASWGNQNDLWAFPAKNDL